MKKENRRMAQQRRAEERGIQHDCEERKEHSGRNILFSAKVLFSFFVSAVAYHISVFYPRGCFLFNRFSSSFSSRLTR